MANPDRMMKANDRLPSYQVALNADLTTATSVKFVMRAANPDWSPKPGTPKVNAAAVFVDRLAGVVRYDWAAVDTDTPGLFVAEWLVIFPGGLPQRFPTESYDTIQINASLDA